MHFLLQQVFKNSPAQEGGLKKFDFVTEIGGQRVETADDVHVVIDRAISGEVCMFVCSKLCTKMHSPLIYQKIALRGQFSHVIYCCVISRVHMCLYASLWVFTKKELSIKVMRDDKEITVQVKPENLSPRLKQLREER